MKERIATERAELEHRLEFSLRQFEHWKLRVVHTQLKVQIALARGETDEATRQLNIATNWMKHLDECNEGIDRLRRQLNPGTTDEV